jgi:hypothetical protein
MAAPCYWPGASKSEVVSEERPCYIKGMNEEEFYGRCARLLNTEHDFHPIPVASKIPRHDGTVRNVAKGRYNQREPGNGRFPGHGLVRHFGLAIHVNLHTPKVYGIFKDPELALEAIARALGVQETYTDTEIEQIKVDRAEVNAAAKAAVQAAGVVIDERMLPNRIVIVGRFLRLSMSDRASIAFAMTINIPAEPDMSDFTRSMRIIEDVKTQDRLAEFWTLIQRYEPED